MTLLERPLGRKWFSALILIVTTGEAASGKALSVDLAFVPASSRFGEYLTAAYDFGTPLAQIESVRLELDIPMGFEGTAATTGNSSFFRYLSMEIHDPANPPPIEYLSQSLQNSAMTIPNGAATEFQFGRLPIYFGGGATFAPWPEFLLTGKGKISLIDVQMTSSHLLPDGAGSTTTSWFPPAGVEGARLIIEGVPVPEPSALMMGLVVVPLSIWAFSFRK